MTGHVVEYGVTPQVCGGGGAPIPVGRRRNRFLCAPAYSAHSGQPQPVYSIDLNLDDNGGNQLGGIESRAFAARISTPGPELGRSVRRLLLKFVQRRTWGFGTRTWNPSCGHLVGNGIRPFLATIRLRSHPSKAGDRGVSPLFQTRSSSSL